MGIYGCIWVYRGIIGYNWVYICTSIYVNMVMGIYMHRYIWVYMGMYGFIWVLMYIYG